MNTRDNHDAAIKQRAELRQWDHLASNPTFTPEQLASAVAQRKHIWSVFAGSPEDSRIDLLQTFCRGLMKTRAAGDYLAMVAMWS